MCCNFVGVHISSDKSAAFTCMLMDIIVCVHVRTDLWELHFYRHAEILWECIFLVYILVNDIAVYVHVHFPACTRAHSTCRL